MCHTQKKEKHEFTHFSHSDSPALLEVWDLDDTAPTGQAVQDAVGFAVATSVISTQTKTARAVIPTEVTTVVQDNCGGGRVKSIRKEKSCRQGGVIHYGIIK